MSPRSSDRIHPEDLSDKEVDRLRRIGFGAAVAVLRCWRDDPPDCTRLEFIESYVAQSGLLDLMSQRYAIAQAAQFLADPSAVSDYVPPDDVADEEWLRFMVEDRGASDTDLAFQIARARGGTIDVARVRVARERLGMSANNGVADADTIAILRRLGGTASSARDLLSNREWLEERVVRRDMSDGEIARELARIGVPCDRSTVRLYRRNHRLRRPESGTKNTRPWSDEESIR